MKGLVRGMGVGRRPAILVVLLGFCACLVADYPGHFTFDSIWQLGQGRAGVFDDWHPPVMAWLLGLADRVSPGAWPFVVADGVMFHGALLAFVALERRPRPIVLPILLLWMLSPIVLIYQGVALKDVLFADSAAAAFAALAWAGRLWERRGLRIALLALSAALFVVAALTRQNGLLAPLMGAFAFGAMTFEQSPPRAAWPARAGMAAAAGLGALVVIGAGFLAATHEFEVHGDHDPQTLHHAKILQVYDLAGAVHRDPAISLVVPPDREPVMESWLRRTAAPHYREAGVDNLTYLPGAADVMDTPGGEAGKAWIRLITRHPGLYLGLRVRVWMNTLTTPLSAACPMIFTGVDGVDGPMMRDAGLRPRQNAKDDFDSDYATAFLHTPLYSHVFYAALLLVALGLCARRWLRGERGGENLAGMGLGLAGLAFAASFFIISIDCDYRFLYFLDVAGMILIAREAAARPRI